MQELIPIERKQTNFRVNVDPINTIVASYIKFSLCLFKLKRVYTISPNTMCIIINKKISIRNI